jgi:hypothetical protein
MARDDYTPEELARIQEEAAQIDPYRYRRRKRAAAAVLLGALGAGLVWVVLEGVDKARNPCQRVERYLCGKDAASLACQGAQAMLRESVDEGAQMRSNMRHQCEMKIVRLKEDEGVVVP